jgi:Protein of unknown function (DUF3313)
MVVHSMPSIGMPRIAATIAALLCMAFALVVRAEDPPAVSSDGLHLVKHTEFAVVYVKPGASLKPYDKFALLDCFVSFAQNWRENMEDDNNNMISDADIKRIETELAAKFKQVFVTELQAGGFQLVTDAAPDVLVLRPAIINLQMQAPPNNWDPGEQTYSASAGQMTLYLELYDSVTSTLLGRVIDPEAATNYGGFTWQSQAGNIAAADGIMKKWSDTLRHYMEAARDAAG